MLFLLNGVLYCDETNDPWFTAPASFNAHIVNNGVAQPITLYEAEQYASVLGCTQQHQWCNPNLEGDKSCTPLTGSSVGTQWVAMDRIGRTLELNAKQVAVLQRIYHAMWDGAMYDVAGFLGGQGLLASKLAGGYLSPALPDNQWILEVQHMFLTGLTFIQMQMAEYITGPGNPAYYQYLQNATTEDETWMCDNQIVQRDGYSSFNVLGLVLIFVLGGLLIITNLSLDKMVNLASRRSLRSNTAKSLDWSTMYSLQLLRMAYQACGMGSWEGHPGSVPVTAMGEEFGMPQMVNLEKGLSIVSDETVGPWASWTRSPKATSGHNEKVTVPSQAELLTSTSSQQSQSKASPDFETTEILNPANTHQNRSNAPDFETGELLK